MSFGIHTMPDIGISSYITTNTTSNLGFTCVVLALVSSLALTISN